MSSEPLLERAWRRLFPKHYFGVALRRIQAIQHEPEMAILSALVRTHETAVDIGAAGGIYCAHLVPYCRKVIAFEPRPDTFGTSELFRVIGFPVEWHTVALSDHDGETELWMIEEDPGRSTVHEDNLLIEPDGGTRRNLRVPVKTLDSFCLDEIGFLKIDVEGHELAVLRGAGATINRNRPTLLIESEGRHAEGAPMTVFDWMGSVGYSGYFLMAHCLVGVAEFDASKYQDPNNIGGWRSGWKRRGPYINNFIFIPNERVDAFSRATAALGFPIAAGAPAQH